MIVTACGDEESILYLGLERLVSAVVGVFCHGCVCWCIDLVKKIAQIIFVVNYGVVRAGVGLEVAIGIVVVGKAAAGAAGEGLGLADEATGGIVAAADGGVGVGAILSVPFCLSPCNGHRYRWGEGCGSGKKTCVRRYPCCSSFVCS